MKSLSQRSLFFVLSLGLAGCGSAAAPASSPAASAKPASASAVASGAPPTKPSSSTAASAAAKPAASGLKPLKTAFTAIATTTIPTWVADAQGFFKQQGLDAQISYVQGSTSSIPALVNGDLQIVETQAAASVQAQLKGADTVSLATHV
ncbi:MAG TPA: ABC transporter substrate-binding protein, partial [Chloroflexota bacterium]